MIAHTLALYGVVMAVDGVALKQAVNAWASAPVAEKAARFASAEAIRWIEWGARSYLFECPVWTVDRPQLEQIWSTRVPAAKWGHRLLQTSEPVGDS